MKESIDSLIDHLPRRDPDPCGDVVLTIGPEEDQRCIKVSSTVLSLASPVFKVIISPPFLEGQAYSSENPRKIDLPEDDANAMTWLCHGLHCVNLSTDDNVPIELLEQLALLVDKYDCASSIAAWTQIWLRQWGELVYVDAERYWDLMSIALAFDDHSAFHQFSRLVIYRSRYTGFGYRETPDYPWQSALAGTIVGDIPDFLEDICARREAVHNSICDSLEEIVAPALAIDPRTCLDAAGASIPTNGCRRSAKIMHFFQYLTSENIWPRGTSWSFHLEEKSIEDMYDRLEEFQNWRFHGEQRPKKHRFYDKSKCRCVVEDYRRKIGEIVFHERQRENGLCLACVKLRRAKRPTYGVDDNCREATLKGHKMRLNIRS
ncbi:MAG: hypothetical protein Q9191_005363 [Dirinaria sp. TL-2023a]